MSITQPKLKSVSNFICTACAGESIRIINHRAIVTDCRLCIAESLSKDGLISQASAVKFCRCFASGHEVCRK